MTDAAPAPASEIARGEVESIELEAARAMREYSRYASAAQRLSEPTVIPHVRELGPVPWRERAHARRAARR
jgi:hypothetical protein